MRILDLSKDAFSALSANKLRSGLTTLGIVIGVGAVVAMMAMTSGFDRFVNSQFTGLGSHTIQVQKRPRMHMGGGRKWAEWRKRKDLTVENADTVRERNEAAQYVGAELRTWGAKVRSRYADTLPNIRVFGGTPEFATNNGHDLSMGRTINAFDGQHERKVMVLGADVAATLFPHSTAVGQFVSMSGRRFLVAGVFASKGSFMGRGGRDNFVLIPITSFIHIYGKNRSVAVTVQAFDIDRFESTRDRTIQILRRERQLKPEQDNDFEVFSNESLVDTISGITDSIALAATGIAFLSLLVGGIGIMNIMMVSVTERTREIGTRMALGARKRHILLQFTAEAIMLSTVGGVLGLGLGYGSAFLTRALAGLPAAAPAWAVLVALGISSSAGLIFGIYPAWRASQLDPIEALRHE